MSYRASDTQPHPAWIELTKDIKGGVTPGQRHRAFLDKLKIGGTMAALTGLGGMVSGQYSKDQELARNKQVMDTAIKRATMADAIGRSSREDQFNRTFRPENYAPTAKAKEGEVPAWLGSHGEGAEGHVFQPTIEDQAQVAAANQDLNKGAADASLGGYRTASGQEKFANSAGTVARDIDTAKQGIQAGEQMGGMGNSLVRNPLATTGVPADNYRDPTDEYFGGGR